MKAITYTHTGDSSVLELHDRAIAEPGTGEVLVRVAVSGVNPTDWKHRRGSGPGQELDFPELVPNQDGAGVVVEVGPGVDDLSVGDRVWVFLARHDRPTGTAQEYVVLPASRVVPLPDGVSFDVGASLGVPAMTAYRALTVSEDWPRRLHPGALDGDVRTYRFATRDRGHGARPRRPVTDLANSRDRFAGTGYSR